MLLLERSERIPDLSHGLFIVTRAGFLGGTATAIIATGAGIGGTITAGTGSVVATGTDNTPIMAHGIGTIDTMGLGMVRIGSTR